MEGRTAPARAGSLVVELAARTVIVDGRRVELPPTEFSLLAVLAARPGEVVTHKELLQEAFGDSAYMDAQDLHWRIWNIRKLIGDRDKKFVRNRRGVGFVLESNVEVLERVASPATTEEVIRLDEEEAETATPATLAQSASAPVEEVTRRRFVVRPTILLSAVAFAGLALGGSWLAGYSLSQRQAGDGPDVAAEAADPEQDGTAPSQEPRNRREPGMRNRKRERERDRASKRVPPVAAPNGVPDQNAAPPPVGSPPIDSGDQDEAAEDVPVKKPAAPSYPPAPTRYLFHLVNLETGDHFVTTEASTASEYQAMGYEGGAIARVYSYQEKDTKAVSTNQGTAYIFISSAPKTEPASRTVPLWYSTNGEGDFFYTTSESEAKRNGWQGSVIGYARSL